MSNTKFTVIVGAKETIVTSHNTKEAAEAAKATWKYNYGDYLDRYVTIVEDVKYTVEDIFLRLLESNPVENPNILWKRAQESFDILSANS